MDGAVVDALDVLQLLDKPLLHGVLLVQDEESDATRARRSGQGPNVRPATLRQRERVQLRP